MMLHDPRLNMRLSSSETNTDTRCHCCLGQKSFEYAKKNATLQHDRMSEMLVGKQGRTAKGQRCGDGATLRSYKYLLRSAGMRHCDRLTTKGARCTADQSNLGATSIEARRHGDLRRHCACTALRRWPITLRPRVT